MFLDRVSHSKLDTYRDCHYKYYAKYHQKLPDQRSDTALQFGSYIHKIFELGVSEFTLSGLEKIAKEQLANYKFSDKEYPWSKITKCLKNFLEFNSSLSSSENIGLELNETIEFNDIKYNGIIDRVVKGKDGNIMLIDYKTSKNEKSKIDLFQDQQLIGYATMISEKLNIPLSKIVCAHFYPLTGTFVPIKYTIAQQNTFKRNVKNIVWGIRKKTKLEFLPIKNRFCNWCGVKYACSLYNTPEQITHNINEAKKQENKPQVEEPKENLPLE